MFVKPARRPSDQWPTRRRAGLRCAAACLALTLVSSARAESIPALHFDPAEGACDDDEFCSFGNRGWGLWEQSYAQKTRGWEFSLLAPATVTHLAVFDEAGDGLATAFEVGVWDSTATLLSSAVIPAGDDAQLSGFWRMVPVEPLPLAAGEFYHVGAAPTGASSDRFFYWNFDPGIDDPPTVDLSAVPFDSRVDVTFSSPRFSDDDGFNWPNSYLLVTGANIGPNVFFAAPVPEPSAVALGLIAAAGCWIAVRRASAAARLERCLAYQNNACGTATQRVTQGEVQPWRA